MDFFREAAKMRAETEHLRTTESVCGHKHAFSS